jgi:hypothetical protein
MNLTIFDGPPGAIPTALVYEVSQLLDTTQPVFVSGQGRPILDFLAATNIAAERPVYLRHSWLQAMVEAPPSRPNPIEVHQHRVLERLALSRGVVRVICLPLAHIENEAMRQIWEGYASAAAAPTRLPTVIARGFEPPDFVAEMVESMRLPNVGPGIGAWRPGQSILIVDGWPRRTIGQPYMGPFCTWRGSYSRWLSQQLESGGICERDLYWIDAYTEGRPADADFINGLQPRAIVALGDKAAEWLLDEGVGGFESAPHPSYWKDHQRRRPYSLIGLLQRTLASKEKRLES